MKKIVLWGMILSYAVIFIAMGAIGIKILEHNYDFQVEAHIVRAGLVVNCLCHIGRLFTYRCPHCGKLRWTNGKYCSYCGKEIE